MRRTVQGRIQGAKRRDLFRKLACLAGMAVSAAVPALGQVMEGEIRVVVVDPDGRPVPAHVAVESRDPEFRAETQAESDGVARLIRLPPGEYRLSVSRDGFQEHVDVVEIRSAVPREMRVTLGLEAVTEEVTVTASTPLVDRAQPSLVVEAGRRQLNETPGTTLGRSTVEVITTMPGWLLEANAVLHPRGSEYDTQYVIDGMPLYDNRSIGFAPAFENSEFEAVNVMTGGIPAEYGRRLGGVISLDTRRLSLLEPSTEASFQVGSYGTEMGAFSHQRPLGRGAVAIGVQGGQTDRYLDPPTLENYTNRGSSAGFNARLEQDLTDRDRLTFYLRSNESRFLVPNDLVQQEAGQRQDRFSGETAGQVHYQRTFSPRTLGVIRAMVRDVTARLWSNTDSTPVFATQDRGLREIGVVGSLSVEGESHSLKLGGDVRIGDVREQFSFGLPEELPDLELEFQDEDRARDLSVFIQDHLRFGDFAANVGVRFDHHSFLTEESGLSPRVGLSYWVSEVDLLLRASYDRVFQPPPMENLLLSSSAAGFGLDDVEESLPVPANRGHFFEVGLRKPFFDAFRLDVSHYWRTFRNYLDDDVFLNTGLSFPITFDTARIQGTEVRLEMPRWGGFSSTLSYSNMIGWATSPVTGGLFVEGGEAEELRDWARFPITQDQRNTAAAQMRYQVHPRVWVSTGMRYGSGLPIELEGDDGGAAIDDIPEVILDRIDFDRGRVKPNFSLDLGGGVRVWERDERSLNLQLDVRNLTDRLNVINFSGLFSGTALSPGRQLTLQTRVVF